jgi:hypothetical protein
MDIKAAFDTLNQKALLLVTSEILHRVSPPKGNDGQLTG